MTFEQFQNSRAHCPDIGAAISADMGRKEPVAGNLYLGTLYIDSVDIHWPEDHRAKGVWHLCLGRDEYISNDLESLEHKLYDWAIEMGYDD